MANRFPLIANQTADQIQEIPAGDFLDLSNSGIANSGNILVSGIVSATGNVTGNFIIGNGSQLTGLPAGYSNADVATYLSSDTVSTNILTTAAVSATGNVTGGNILTSGSLSTTGGASSINVGTATGFLVTSTNNDFIGTNKTSGDITMGGTLQTGNITVGRATSNSTLNLSAGAVGSGNTKVINIGTSGASGSQTTIAVGPTTIGANANVNFGLGAVVSIANSGSSALSVAGTVISAVFSQPVGGTNLYNTTTNSLQLGTQQTTGTITIGGTAQTGTTTIAPSTANSTINIGAGATSSGNIKNINIGTSGVTGSNTNILIGPIGGGSGGVGLLQVQGNTTVSITNTGGSALSVAGTVTAANVLTGGTVSATGAITTAGDLTLTGNIVDTSALNINTLGNANITLNAGTGFIIASSGILNGQANGVGNIGSSSGYFNTIFARATSAQYADLAEMYVADAAYEPGTVLEFGGNKEVTITTQSHSTRVAGIVSTNPSYLMNATQTGDHVVPVALTGRVPCRVVGNIEKGDRLVASIIAGVAQRLDPSQYQPACIIGKALENYSSEEIGTIEVAVGRT